MNIKSTIRHLLIFWDIYRGKVGLSVGWSVHHLDPKLNVSTTIWWIAHLVLNRMDLNPLAPILICPSTEVLKSHQHQLHFMFSVTASNNLCNFTSCYICQMKCIQQCTVFIKTANASMFYKCTHQFPGTMHKWRSNPNKELSPSVVQVKRI